MYTKPATVLSPKARVSDVEVLLDLGEGSWSIVDLVWDKNPGMGIRWNGGSEDNGSPQSRGIPTWFILPEEIEEIIRKNLSDISNNAWSVVTISKDLATDFIYAFSKIYREAADSYGYEKVKNINIYSDRNVHNNTDEKSFFFTPESLTIKEVKDFLTRNRATKCSGYKPDLEDKIIDQDGSVILKYRKIEGI